MPQYAPSPCIIFPQGYRGAGRRGRRAPFEPTSHLDIGHVRSMGNTTTLATLGRNGDVFVGGSSISRIQCSFEIEPTSKVVMFYDRSHNGSSQVSSKNATPLEHGRSRKVVVQQDVNTVIGMGGVGRDLVQFELQWHLARHSETMDLVKDRETATLEENPRLARTIDEADTTLPSRRGTRMHTPGPQLPRMRYRKEGRMLGAGQFGEVYRAVDMDSGKLMAVKILKPPPAASEEWSKVYSGLKREVEHLSRISHPHIVNYIASEDWDGPNPRIFMGLKEGTLTALIKGGCSIPLYNLGTSVFYHMLQALDYLATEGTVHRDVKPDNILYVSGQGGQYHFQLGDFGFSNYTSIAATFAGSPLFMAPEMFENGRQSPKLDVWSLYVTMLWTLDAGGFRKASEKFNTINDAREAILHVASKVDIVSNISEMARINPDERASAAQMLVKCFNGEGLSTPRAKVPRLITSLTRGDGIALATANPTTTSPPQ